MVELFIIDRWCSGGYQHRYVCGNFEVDIARVLFASDTDNELIESVTA